MLYRVISPDMLQAVHNTDIFTRLVPLSQESRGRTLSCCYKCCIRQILSLMRSPPAWLVYAEQLVDRGHGLPLWHPEPRSGPHGDIQIGDVGYVSEGRFIRFFNAMHSAKCGVNKGGVPKDFAMLTMPEDIDAHNFMSEPYHQFPGAICASTTVVKNVGAGISDGAQFFNTSLHFSCNDNRGAVAILGDFGHQEWYLSNIQFRDYVKKYHSSWYDFALTKGYPYSPSAIVLVSGWLKTTQWAAAAVSSSGKALDFSLSASAGSYVSANVQASTSKEVRTSVEQRWGPPVARHLPHNRDSDAASQATQAIGPAAHEGLPTLQSGAEEGPDAGSSGPGASALQSPVAHEQAHKSLQPALPCNQCMFIRYYKLKTRKVPLTSRVRDTVEDSDIVGPGDDDDSFFSRSRSSQAAGGSSPPGFLSRVWRSKSSGGANDAGDVSTDEQSRSEMGLGRSSAQDHTVIDIEEEPATSETTPDVLDDMLDMILESSPSANAAVISHDDFYSIFPPDRHPRGITRLAMRESARGERFPIHIGEDGVAFVGETRQAGVTSGVVSEMRTTRRQHSDTGMSSRLGAKSVVTVRGKQTSPKHTSITIYMRINTDVNPSMSGAAFKTLSQCLFLVPRSQLEELTYALGSYHRWRRFLHDRGEDWNNMMTLATVLLSVNVAFLSIDGTTASSAPDSVPRLLCFISAIFSMSTCTYVLILKRHSKLHPDINQGILDYIPDSSNHHDLERVALIFSLPVALCLWSILAFLMAVVSFLFDAHMALLVKLGLLLLATGSLVAISKTPSYIVRDLLIESQ